MSTEAAPRPAPLPLRLIYTAVFSSFAAMAIAVSTPEWAQLWAAVSRPYYFGDPPSPIALGASGLCGVGGALLVWRFVKGRGASLPLSVLIIAGAVVSGAVAGLDVPTGRTWAAADKAILEAATLLRAPMAKELQEKGEVPRDDVAWEMALNKAIKEPFSPARGGGLGRLPYTLVRLATQDAEPPVLRPGTFLVWVSPDGAAFELTPVGFDKSGQVARLWDEAGRPLVLRSVFNPDNRVGVGSP